MSKEKTNNCITPRLQIGASGKYYILKNKKMPWGSYGEILYAGINILDKKTGNYYISRTAPFVPQIYKDTHEPFLFVTETLKQKIEKANLKGISFQKAIKDKIVSLEWEKWNLSAAEPAVYPSGDMDAEEYIVNRKNNENLAAKMGTIWAVILQKNGFVIAGENPVLVEQSIDDLDIFTAKYNSREIFMSEKAVLWFKENIKDEVYFEEFSVRKIEKMDFENIQNSYNQYLATKEKAEKMTDKDWQLWHRLKREAEKLLKDMENAKKEETRLRWKEKAIENLKILNEIYPLNEREKADFEKLIGKSIFPISAAAD